MEWYIYQGFLKWKGRVDMIKVSDLHVIKGKKEILNITELDLGDSRCLGIFGHNGAGKTTLVRCLMGIEDYEGMIDVKFRNRNTQIVLQKNGYSPYARVKDILMLVLNITVLDSIMEFIYYISFEKCLDKEIGVLSGGELQKLNLTLVLMSKPDLLIIDEVTTGLDFETRKKIQTYLLEFIKKSDCRLIMISHYKEELEILTEKVICMKNGHIVDVCMPQAIQQEMEADKDVAITETNFNRI